jgi:ABC-type transport system involved in multi-copper enzyme maturation permease subunit
MLNSTLALFTRSFRIDARSLQPHVVRCLFTVLILLSLMWAHMMSMVFAAPGQIVFVMLIWLNFILVTLAAIGFFATAISEEKDEDSLGLLKMAGISPAALLLGKSTTRVASILLVMAVQFPFVMLSITLGGVTMGQVVSASLSLAAYMVFVANLGLFCSVFCKDSRRATSLMMFLMIGLLIILPIVSASLHAFSTFNRAGATGAWYEAAGLISGAIDAVSVTSRLSRVLSSGFSDSPLGAQVIFHFLASIALFVLSWTTFERFTRESHATTRIEKALEKPLRTSKRVGASRAWDRALAWKDFYFITGGRKALILKLLFYPVVILAICSAVLFTESFSQGLTRERVGGTAMILMLIFGVAEISLFAARVFRDEVKAQSLPLLMMLPFSTSQLAWSKVSAVFPAMIPACLCLLLGALIYPEGVGEFVSEWVPHSAFWYGVVTFFLFLFMTAYFSLVVKWGALPLAIFAIYLLQMFQFMIGGLIVAGLGFRPSGEIEVFLVLTVIAVGGIVGFAHLIRLKLEALAGR